MVVIETVHARINEEVQAREAAAEEAEPVELAVEEPVADEPVADVAAEQEAAAETATLEEALATLALPRTVGTATPPKGEEELPILAANGRYGPYLKWGKETRSLDEEADIFSIDLDAAYYPKAWDLLGDYGNGDEGTPGAANASCGGTPQDTCNDGGTLRARVQALFDQFAAGDAQGGFVTTGPVDVAAEAVELWPVTARIAGVVRICRHADRLEPVRAAIRDMFHAGERFDIVDDGRLSIETAISWISWWFRHWHAALAFNGFDHRRLFAADVGAGATA